MPLGIDVDFRLVLDGLITLGNGVAPMTNTTIDDKGVEGLEALRDSPKMLDWIESLWTPDLPPGAMPQTLPPDDVLALLQKRGLTMREIMEFVQFVQQAIAFLKAIWGK